MGNEGNAHDGHLEATPEDVAKAVQEVENEESEDEILIAD